MIDASPGPASILAGLPNDLSSRLFMGAIPHRLRPGETLFHAGDAGDGCYRLRMGLLRVMIESPEGDELVVAFLSPGAMVGELAVIDGLPRSATVVAVKACELSFIPRGAFEECMRAQPELYRCLVESLAARLRETNDALAAASFLNSQGRLARALLELVGVVGEDVGNGRFLIAHEIRTRDLAAMAGIARENASRILSDWRRRKIVTRVADRYCIEDAAALRHEME
jgi:CRP/FNR family cyclic AMP-dependent transcriptional regulator